MGKIKSIILKDSERLALETGFRQGDSHCFRMRCRAVLLKSTGLSSKAIGLQTENLHHPLTFTVFTLAAILIFAASYLLSVRIHRKKEF